MTSEVLQQRAEMEQGIAGRTLCDQLRETAEQGGSAPAYSDRRAPDAAWETLTWAQTRQQALELAAGFAALGLAPGERVALLMPNRVEHVLADLGAVHACAVPVTFYATLSADQIAYMAAGLPVVHHGAPYLVVEPEPGARQVPAEGLGHVRGPGDDPADIHALGVQGRGMQVRRGHLL